MNSKHFYFIYFLILSIFISSHQLNAQSTNVKYNSEDLNKVILELDNQFWKAYNTCDLENFKTFLTDDLEFYHDKGGLTTTLSKLMTSVKNGLCGNKNMRLRREAVKSSVNVYPLNNYGAIISGQHTFYLTENGEKEKLIEKAKFTHIWQLKENRWKMSRIISYDHQPISENTSKDKITLSKNELLKLTGEYKAPNTGIVNISIIDNTLEINAGKMIAKIYPESETLFFHKQASLTFEFIKNDDGSIIKFIIRENGKIVEEAKRIK